MKDEELIAKWEDRLKSGQEYMKDYARPDNWHLYRNYYRGEFPTGSAGQRKYSTAIIFAILRSMIPRIYFTNPAITVTNEVPGYYLASKIVQKIDNKMIRDSKLKYTLKEIIREAGLCGTIPILNGYDSAYGYDPAFKETMTDEQGNEFDVGSTLLQFDTKTGDRLEYNSLIRPGQPWSDNIKPEKFIVPYGYARLWHVPWVARLYTRRLEDVKLDKRLKNTKNLKANGMTNFSWFKEQQLHQKMISKDEKEEYVFLWEIRDLRTGRMMIIQEGNREFLYNEIDYLQKFGNPYMELTFNYDSETFWGLPDAKYLEDQQLAVNEIRTLHMEHRRIAKARFVYDENIIDDEEVEKVVTEDTGAGIKANGDIDKAIKQFQPYVPPDFNIDVDAIRKDAREMIGYGRNQVGEFEGGRRTATESNIVNMATQIRVSERKDIIADLLTDIIKKYNKYIFSEWHVSQVEDIVGPDGKRYWVSFNHKQIDSNYGFKVDPESGQPVSSDQRRQEAIAVAQYIHNSPIVQMAIQAGKEIPYNLEALDRYVLSQFDTVPLEEIMPPRAGMGNNPEQPMPLEALQEKFRKQEAEANANIQVPMQ